MGAAERVVTKWVGVRVIVVIEGQGGMFDGITTMQHIGAGLALMSIATLVRRAVLRSVISISIYLSISLSLYIYIYFFFF